MKLVLGFSAVTIVAGCEQLPNLKKVGVYAVSGGVGVGFDRNAQTVSESAGAIVLTVQAESMADFAIDVPFTASGTATNPEDHTIPSVGWITIPAGSNKGTASFRVVNDRRFEVVKSLVVTLGDPVVRSGFAHLGTQTSQALTFVDDDVQPTVAFATSNQSVGEEAGSGVATLQLSALTSEVVQVPYVVSGTASSPADHNLSSGTLSIPAGATTADLLFTLVNDGTYEGNETVIITLGTPVGATLGTAKIHTATLVDSSPVPTIQWSAVSQAVTEAVGKVTLRLQISAASQLAVSAPYTVAGTSAAPLDHNLVAGTLQIPAGSTSADLTFDVLDDVAIEDPETIVVTLGLPTGANLGANAVHTVTISDNDLPLPPVARWSAAFQTVAENVGVVTATAVLDKTSLMPVTIPFVVAGTAVRPADHDLANGTITIPAGTLMASASFSIVDDAIYEGAETVSLSLGAPTNASLGTPAVQIVTIQDNELLPLVSFALAAQSKAENGGAVSVAVRTDKTSALPVTVGFTVSGNATNPADHTLSAGSVTIPAGSTTATIPFSVVDDLVYEGNETITLSLANPTGAMLGAQISHTVTIAENETAPIVRFNLPTQLIQESTGSGTIQVVLDKMSATSVTLPYMVAGTASNPGDHNLAAGSLTIAAGQSSANISFTLVKDAVTEVDETIVVTLGTPVGATLGTPAVHTATITDSVGTPTIQWRLASQTALENAASITVTAELNAPGMAPVTVPYALSGTATATSDFSAVNGTIVIPTGATSANLTFSLIDDALNENVETIVLTMGAPTGAILGLASVHTVTITDNDLPPVAQFGSGAQTVLENVGSVTIPVALSVASGRSITIPYTVGGTAAAPADHSLVAGSITIAAGATSGAIAFTVVDDTLFEGTETLVVSLGSPTGAALGTTVVHTATITDNETAPTLQWALASSTALENAGTVTVQATLSAALTVATSVPFTVTGTATAPADHNLASGSLTIPAGVLSANASITIVNDAAYEGSETVILTLGNPTPSTLNLGARTVHTLTIGDDESAPTVQFALAAQTVQENGGNATLNVTLNTASGVAVNVPYTLSGTATNATDYTFAAGTIAFAAGITTRPLTIPIIDDSLTESDETLILTLGAPTGATSGTIVAHTITIKDNDVAPVVQFSLASQTVLESAGTVTLTATLNVAGGAAISVPITIGSTSTAGSPSDFTLASTTLSIPAGSTSMTYPVTVVNDTLNEDAETIVLNMGTPTNATLGVAKTHTVTITDNDAMPLVQWSIAAQSVDENAGSATAVATLSAASGKSITVGYAAGGTANNVAAARTKYTLAPGTLTIPAGTVSMNLVIPLINDSLPGPSDFTIVLSLSAPTNATVGAIAIDTMTIADNDASSVSGEEGYRTTVWPLTRARCISCHGASASLPNHASDSLAAARTAALPLVNFLDIPNARLVSKSADGHCGANCNVNGLATDTKPLMIAAIQAWAPYESGVAPSPTPTATTPVADVPVGIKDAQQYLEFLTGSAGLLTSTYRYSTPFSELRERLSQTGDPTAITPTMLLAYTTIASKVCLDFVNAEKVFAVNSASRQAFGPINFTVTTNIVATVLTTANINTVANNLASVFLKRPATATEMTALNTMITNAVLGIVPTATDTTRLMVTACTAFASSLDGISN